MALRTGDCREQGKGRRDALVCRERGKTTARGAVLMEARRKRGDGRTRVIGRGQGLSCDREALSAGIRRYLLLQARPGE